MNVAEVIEYARRWADLHRANAYQREGVTRVDALLALAEEQATTIARYDVLDEAIADYERAERAEAAVARVRGLAEWHETKAEKARRYRPESSAEVMDKAAAIHNDAARRLRAALDEEDT